MLRAKKVKHGDGLKVVGKLFVHGDGHVSFGDRVTIFSSENVNPISGGIHTHLSAVGSGRIVIGNDVGISHSCLYAKNLITIGDHSLIGSNCVIVDNDFHEIIPDDRLNNVGNVSAKPIHIGENVFIGTRSIILKGVTIGNNSVIGAGSVVTKNIPANQMWGGSPAHFIKGLDGK